MAELIDQEQETPVVASEQPPTYEELVQQNAQLYKHVFSFAESEKNFNYIMGCLVTILAIPFMVISVIMSTSDEMPTVYTQIACVLTGMLITVACAEGTKQKASTAILLFVLAMMVFIFHQLILV